MAGSVPVAGSLADIYPTAALATEAPRWNDLLSSFEKAYGHKPSFVARSPGRVNILGEHIDYSLYSVLPMAITADAIMAVSSAPLAEGASTLKVRIGNVEDSKFAASGFDVPVDADVDIDASKFEWTNYFKSGLRGAMKLLRKKRGQDFKGVNMEIMVDGTVPVGGGLSSSAAIVTASALAVMKANGVDAVDKTELTELAIVSERAVGVNSGGGKRERLTFTFRSMDQAASVFSEPGSALFVSFSPRLEAHPVKIPPTRPELCFLIAQSFVTANKHVTGPIHYNLRVVEVSFAAAYLNAVLNPSGTRLPVDAGPLGISLQGFHDTYFYHANASDYSAAKSLTKEEELEKLIAVTKETLTQEEGYTREEIAKVLSVTVQELENRFTAKIPIRAERFMLRQRALHVFTEALRVLKFLTLLERPVHTGASDTTRFNKELGSIMNETQDSCRILYENSCPENDKICRIALEAGSYGSRQTGAGWGGCSVHLISVDKVEQVKEALEREYYSKMKLTEDQKAQAMVPLETTNYAITPNSKAENLLQAP
ncbi:Galactokinase [Metarhizium anisopliae]|nr:Galactokinase [Metarhizium anisopliae]